MGCFPACFGHLRHKQIMKNGPDQCLCPSNELQESVNLLPPASTESLKEEEIVGHECKKEEQTNKSIITTPVFYHSKVDKVTNEVSISNSDNDIKSVEKEMKKEFTSMECCPGEEEEEEEEEEESSESLFSLSIDSRKHVFGAEMGEKEVNSAVKKNSDISVKPVEKAPLKFDEDKENVPSSKDFTMNQSFDELKKLKIEVAVDTSLSSWLVGSEKSPKEMKSIGNSPESEKNYGEREVLGAIASPMEFKEMNWTSSGGSTPCCTADDHLGVGTVGKYWRRTGGAHPSSGSSCRGVSTVCTNV